ncbi:NYN domain-containing protein [Actinomadura rubrobrunea]|uniref:NYN domain-containing protein n=1 Tax=Actinomadura rubrobrunea TaxID=115335 RepID=A0A9W6PZN2_9ACTN|nr:NYN domain-containing protein [Actinomadura rubrobrunea]GLW65893.1 NYN domain-containing protein [Actinomadura rubrobrunea]
MRYIRSALYLDFDNVFSGIFKLDPKVAIQFASNPRTWLRRLSTALTEDAERRWLILRCYLNPAGHVEVPGESRVYFSRFRTAFVRAGFEVVDCPRYNATKNGADIKIVVDALDALWGDAVHEEFVIASGDCDLTPLLHRLRRADRRTVIVSSADTAEAFTASADQVLDSQWLLALVQGELVDFDDEADAADEAAAGDAGGSAGAQLVSADQDEAYQAFRSLVTAEYDNASTPLNMAALAQQVRDRLGGVINETDWFGFHGFARAVNSLNLPHLRMSQHLLWDESRHVAPADAVTMSWGAVLPEPIERLAELTGLPRLPQESWPAIYRTLSDYVHAHQFNLTECTGWSRDRLREQGHAVSRKTVAFVARGTAYGGCPLYQQPPPTAEQIAVAFVRNVLNRAEEQELTLTEDEIAMVRTWLGAEVPVQVEAATVEPDFNGPVPDDQNRE